MNTQEKTALITKLEQLLNERLTLADAIDVHDMYEVTDVDVDHDEVEVIEASFSVDYEAGGRRSRVDMDSVRVEVPDSAVTISVQASGDYVEHLLVDPDLIEKVLAQLKADSAPKTLAGRLRDIAQELELEIQEHIERGEEIETKMHGAIMESVELRDQVNLDGRRIAELTDSITALRLKAAEQEEQVDRLLREKSTLCTRVEELEKQVNDERRDWETVVCKLTDELKLRPEMPTLVGDVEDVSSSNINI